MQRKMLIIALCSFAALFLGLYWIYYAYFTNNETDPLRFVPDDSAVVIEAPNLKNLTQRLKNDNEIWQNLKGFSFMKTNNLALVSIDSLLDAEKDLEKLTRNKKIILSLLDVDKAAELLLLMPLPSATDSRMASRFFKNFCKNNPNFEKIELDGNKAFCFKYGKKNKKCFYFSIIKGFVVGASSSELIKGGICGARLSKSVLDDNVFRRINATKSKSSDAHIFINYKALAEISEPNLRTKSVSEKLQRFTHWSVADLQASTHSISFTGFSLPEPNRDYLYLLVHQSPVKMDPSEGLPASTDAFLSFGLESVSQLFADYHDFLDMYNQLSNQPKDIEKIEKTLTAITDKEVCLAFVHSTTDGNLSKQAVAAIKLKDSKTTASALAKVATLTAVDSGEIKGKAYKIYSFDEKSFLSKAFGDIVHESASNFVAIAGQYAYFANSHACLKEVVTEVCNGNTLSENDFYSNLSASLTSQCNFYAYLSPSSSCDIADYVFSRNTAKLFTLNYRTVNKFGGLVLQLSSNKEMVYHNLVLLSKTDDRKNTKLLWSTHLEAGVSGKPTVFESVNNEKVIFVADLHGNAYLMDSDGEQIWKKRAGKIMSRVFAIDYYNNGKIQFLFNTSEQLHLIDRKGNEVEGYPIALKSAATNGLTVFDYEGKKDYRIFIACENKKVLCLDKKGKPVEGWKVTQTNSVVKTEINHFTSGDKDYLVFSSSNEVYLLDRKGAPRVKINEKLNFAEHHNFFIRHNDAQNYWVSNLRNGQICSIMPSGKVQLLEIKKLPKEYYFTLIEPKGDPEKHYIALAFSDKLEVYDNDHQLLFDYSFKGNISSEPEIIEVDGETKLAVSISSESKIYLFNLDGSLYRGFPFNGFGQYTLTRLGNKDSRYNILVGDNAGNLVCYVLD